MYFRSESSEASPIRRLPNPQYPGQRPSRTQPSQTSELPSSASAIPSATTTAKQATVRTEAPPKSLELLVRQARASERFTPPFIAPEDLSSLSEEEILSRGPEHVSLVTLRRARQTLRQKVGHNPNQFVNLHQLLISDIIIPFQPKSRAAWEAALSPLQLTTAWDGYYSRICAEIEGMVDGTEWEHRPVTGVLGCYRSGAVAVPKRLYELCGEVMNHYLYWRGINASSSASPSSTPTIKAGLVESFGSLDEFKRQFFMSAESILDGGFTWLMRRPVPHDRILHQPQYYILNTFHGGTETVVGAIDTPLLCVNVCEHAYYIDHGPRRTEYLRKWWDAVDWSRVEDMATRAPLIDKYDLIRLDGLLTEPVSYLNYGRGQASYWRPGGSVWRPPMPLSSRSPSATQRH